MASSKKSTTEEKKSKETKPKNTPKQKNKTTSTTKGNPEKNNNNNKVSNGTVSDSSSDVIIIPSSSIESGQDEKQKPNKSSDVNKRTAVADADTNTKSKKHKQKKQKRQEEEVNDVVDKEEAKTHRFPMNRIKTILRSQDSDLRITHEALFLVNKATEKFLEEFTKDAHACCVQDHKKSLAYKHLSSVVCKTRSFDFLSDFVPEKLKAKDALAERKIAETENEAA
ncbi:DNA polymerase II subunit B3-1 [Quercus robur]|uniref:DNA polymerase II subunit B3-1 n=1 Tax=Quercus robur TaxID=38942 RepID=UPI002161EED2|nr:DNA polymerase II subunit B3-1 [Quercus robur]